MRLRMLTGFLIVLVLGLSPSLGQSESLNKRIRTNPLSGKFVTISRWIERNSQEPRKKRRKRQPDVIYYPTPPETVAEMLRLGNIKKGDVLFDLGSGDGRIPIAAARQFGIRAVGIEIDPKLITDAESNAREAGVADLVRFRNEDMFRVDVSEANIVTLYLSEKLNVLLRPKLLRELRPGARIISHDFRMGDWKPEHTVRVPWGKLYRTVYLWIVPKRAKPRARREVSDDVGKILAGTREPPVSEEEAYEREGGEVGEPGPVRRSALNQNTAVAPD